MNVAPVRPVRGSPGGRRRSSSRFCAFGLDDADLRDVVFGSLSPILVCFMEDDDPSWDHVAAVVESVASARLRCLVAAPSRCRTAATLFGYRGSHELLLLVDGRTTRRLGPETEPAELRTLLELP